MISKLKDRTRLRNRTTAQTQTLAAIHYKTMSNEIFEKVESRGELILSRQIDSYRAIQNRAGLLLGTLTIFISFYPALIKDFNFGLRNVGISSFIVSTISIVLTLIVLRHKKLDEGIGEHRFEPLINENYDDYMNQSISALKTSIEANDKKLKKMNKKFNMSLYSFIFALLLSVLTIILNYIRL
jgi:hypothetical protein